MVIVAAIRTPITKAKRGAFKDRYPEDLLKVVLQQVCNKAGVDPSIVQDVAIGNVLGIGSCATSSRMAALAAGIPNSTSLMTVNRQCSSGLQAVASIASSIKAGWIEVGIGGGVESMSMHYGPEAIPRTSDQIGENCKEAADCLIPMGITSENVAIKFEVSRRKQDEFAMESHLKASKAKANGLFQNEIVSTFECTEDEGIRNNISLEGLSALKPSFRDDGTTTAGNSSQISDGAAAVLLMKRERAIQLGVAILGKFVDYCTVGVPPSIMGIGPAVAIPVLLQRNKLKINNVDIYEINEAFASQAVFCIERLGIPIGRVNPKGGAIALGHPLGCTGARQISTLLPELSRTGGKIGIVSMCVGTGMGAAALIINEHY